MLTDLACSAIPSVTADGLATRCPGPSERRLHRQLAGRLAEAAAAEIVPATEIVTAHQRGAVRCPLPRLGDLDTLLNSRRWLASRG